MIVKSWRNVVSATVRMVELNKAHHQAENVAGWRAEISLKRTRKGKNKEIDGMHGL